VKRIMKITLRSVLGLLLLLSPALLRAQMGYNSVVVVPDGRIETDSVPANTSSVYLFSTLPGHSYSIEQSRGLSQPTLPMYVFAGCPGPFMGNAVNDTSSMDPAVALNTGFGQQRQREAFACTGPVFPSMTPGQASIMINNFNPAPYTFSITVTDTTLLSAKWAATINSDTFWTFTNTSSAPVNISINTLDATGFAQFFPGLPFPGNSTSIAPGAVLSIDTTQIPPEFRANPPGGTPLGGSVRVTEDGPPGAILATATIVTNAGSPTPTTESVKIAPKHQ
jgi:hypothetical protein